MISNGVWFIIVAKSQSSTWTELWNRIWSLNRGQETIPQQKPLLTSRSLKWEPREAKGRPLSGPLTKDEISVKCRRGTIWCPWISPIQILRAVVSRHWTTSLKSKFLARSSICEFILTEEEDNLIRYPISFRHHHPWLLIFPRKPR